MSPEPRFYLLLRKRYKKDYKKAFNLFEKSAIQGDSDAQLKLGIMYANGHSVKQDFSDELLVFGIASFKNNALYTQQNIVLSQNQENVYTTNNIKPKVKIQGDSLIITDSSCQSQSNKSILSSLKHNVSQSNIVMQEDCERDTKKSVKSKN